MLSPRPYLRIMCPRSTKIDFSQWSKTPRLYCGMRRPWSLSIVSVLPFERLTTADSCRKGQYKPDLSSPLASPVLFDHTGIPKTYFVACGGDLLRDCTLILEQVWKDEGIPTRLDIYPGIPHAGWVFFPETNFARKHVEDSREALRWLMSL